MIHSVSTPAALNTSVKDWYNTVLTPNSGDEFDQHLATSGSSWIDVRDLGEAHALALQKDAAGGERMIVSAGLYKWQDWGI